VKTTRRDAGFPAASVRDLHICTSVFVEAEGAESAYPQVPGAPSSQRFQAAYWRCAVVLLASSYRQQPTAQHILFTNAEAVPQVDGIDVNQLLQRLGVEIAPIPFTFAPPPHHYPAWRGCFYKFDVLHALAARLDPGHAALFLDADCVFVASADAIGEAVIRDGLLAYALSYPIDWKANGLSRQELSELAGEALGSEVRHPLAYCGAELLAATHGELGRLLREIDVAWDDLVSRCQRGERRFLTEEHVLSYVYYKLRYPIGNADPFIRRIWTGSLGAFNNSLPTDHGLVLWHVPMEKRLGLRRLFRDVADERSRFWDLAPGTPLREYLASHLGIHRNKPQKVVSDLAVRIVDRFRYS
jgi:hypothetical protein